MSTNDLISSLEREMTSLKYSNTLYKETITKIKNRLPNSGLYKELIDYISLVEEFQKKLDCNKGTN